MKQYNLLNHIVKVDKKSFLDALNSGRRIAITPEGEIVEENENGTLPPQLYIYAGKPGSLTGNGVGRPTPLSKILGENYEVRDEGERVAISADKAWERIVEANLPRFHYLDVAGEGIGEFSDKELDNLIWYSCEFGINYREVAEHLEKSVDGTVLCIEHLEPYRFNGCVYIDDIEKARRVAFDFIVSELKRRIDEGAIDTEDLEDEEEEALRFFGLL